MVTLSASSLLSLGSKAVAVIVALSWFLILSASTKHCWLSLFLFQEAGRETHTLQRHMSGLINHSLLFPFVCNCLPPLIFLEPRLVHYFV